MPDNDESLGEQQTYEGGAQPADSSDRSLGDRSTFGGGADSSLSDIGGLTGDADLDMEIADLSRYEVQETLGKGGMGEVLLATDTRLNRKVAIKRMLGDGAKSQTAVKRFLTEAQSIAALNHLNIVQIYDYGRDKDGPFLIMEYVDGGSLLDRCREGAIPVDEAIELTCQLCDGLGKAHDAGIIHRDIKPANVLLTGEGVPKLTDFGLAKDETADAGLSVAGAVLGTLDFMPPEQRRDSAQTDSRSDLWSLAATLYQMLTAESPRVIDLDAVPAQLRQTLSTALKLKSEDRYQTAAEFRDALRECLHARGPDFSDLRDGQCLYCGTRNEGSRNFCRECAGSLRVKCLGCAAEIAVWEKVCGECGAKQNELTEPCRLEMASRQAEAEELLNQHDYAAATAIATTLRDEPDPRFQHLADWAARFLQDVESNREQQLARMSQLLHEALQHEAAYDYRSGCQTLEQVPSTLRSTVVAGQSASMSDVLSRLHEKDAECRRLHELIHQRVKRRELTGLLSEVETLLVLRPDRKDAVKLKNELIERDRKLAETRDVAVIEARRLFESQEYEACLMELRRIDSSVMQQDAIELREQAKAHHDRLHTLRQFINEAVHAKQFDGLLKKVDEYLTLRSDDAELQTLRERLVARDEKNAAKVVSVLAKARSLRQACRFESALKLLEKMPEDLGTLSSEISDLKHDCRQLADLHEVAMRAVEAASAEEMSVALITGYESDISGYRNALTAESLEDPKFLSVCHSTASKLSQLRGANEQQRKIRLAIAGAAGVLLLITVGLWVNSYLSSRQQAAVARIAEQERILAEPPLPNSIGMAFKPLPGGTFTMGDANGDDDEAPHQVTLTKPFELGVYEVTQEQYEAVMGTTPSYFKGPQNPAENVSWNEAVEFCRKLSELPAEKSAGYEYRLPTEAEWECACRAGTKTQYSFGDSASELGAYEWYGENSGKTTHPVGGKKPNAWGLYDMHGNVWEWCQDWHGDYPSGSVTDPTGPASGSLRVGRGGGWGSVARGCRSAFRGWSTPDDRYYYLGFRVLRSSIK